MMDTNEPKKWRTDYSLLLKCWSMLKTSELLTQTARNELKSFTAEEKAINRLKTFTEKNESLTVLDQTINLWQQSIDQFINQNNFLAAAECLENLSEIQFKYGSNELKKESLNTLLRASKYYKRASESKRAIIAIKRYLTISEFSTERDIDLISSKYKECEVLYEALDLHDMSELNRKIGNFFKEISPYIENSLKIKQRKSSIEFKSNFSELTTASNGEHWMPSTSIRQQLGIICVSDNTNNSDENEVQNKDIDDKEPLKELIKQMNEKNDTKCESSDHNSESDDDNTEDMEEPISNCRSNQLLRQNLKKLKNSNKFDVSDQTSNEKTVKKVKTSSISDKKVMTTEITVVPTKTKYKRNRRPKPKESSEELPEKRILKLNRKDLIHFFEVDYKNPLKRLYCRLCKDSVLSYRWSTITDHLETKKHKNIELMQEMSQMFQITGEHLIHNNSNNNNSSHLGYSYNTTLSEIDYNFLCKTNQSEPFILTIDSTPTEGTQNTNFLPLNSIQSNTPLMLEISDPMIPIDDNNQNRTLNTPEINLENDPLKIY